MMKLNRAVFTTLLWVVVGVSSAFAQQGNSNRGSLFSESQITASQFTVETAITTEQGLPANGVNGLLQDSDNYIWAATYNGLVRYDGKNIKAFKSSNIDGLSSNRFLSLTETQDGSIWAGLEKNALLEVRDDTVLVHKIAKADSYVHVNELEADDQGRIWIGTTNGLYLYSDQSFQKIDELPLLSINAIKVKGEKVYVVFKKSIYLLNSKGEVEGKILEIDEKSILHTPRYSIKEFENVVTDLSDLIIKGDELWAVLHTGIVRLRSDSYKVLLNRSHIKSHALHGMMYHEGGDQYFVYGSEGLFSIKELGIDSMQVTSYTDHFVMDVIIDHEESVWASTRGQGIRQFTKTPVYQGDRFNKVREVPLLALMKDEDGALWIGTNCDGLYRYRQGDYTSFGASQGLKNGCVWSLEQSADNTIWAGTWGGGLYYRTPDRKRFERFMKTGFEDVNVIFSIFQDSSGDIWIGSYKNGLFHFNGELLTRVTTVSGKTVPPVRRIYEGKAGKIWLATDKGIGIVRQEGVVLLDKFNRLSTRNFRTIQQDSVGRYWFGSYGGGIVIHDPNGEIRTLTAEDGLFDETVSQLQFDREGNLWLAGNKGIAYIEKSQITAYLQDDIDEVRVAHIGTRRGLQIRETSGGFQPSHYLDKEGRLYIPMVQGMSVIHTDRMQLNREFPNVVINRVMVDGRPYSTTDIEEISYDVRRLVFNFSALSYADPKAVQYRYKMEGFEDEWNEAGPGQNAVYTSLETGSYTFRVKASNNDGFWSQEGGKVNFSVYPPIWNRTWFYVVGSLLITALFLGGYQWRIYSVKRYNRKLERQVRERTRELKDTNRSLKQHIDEKNRLMSILAHDLRNPFTSIIGYLQLLQDKFMDMNDREEVEMVTELLQSTQHTHELLENLLQWANAKQGGLNMQKEELDLNLIIKHSVESVASQSHFKDIEVIESVPEQDTLPVYCDPNMITAVIRNLLSNAIKFSKRGAQVTIKVDDKDGKYLISVSDEGKGIENDNLEAILSNDNGNRQIGTDGEKGIGMGLMLCKEFIEKHDGEIWVDSEVGEGSTFSFTLPASYENASRVLNE